MYSGGATSPRGPNQGPPGRPPPSATYSRQPQAQPPAATYSALTAPTEPHGVNTQHGPPPTTTYHQARPVPNRAARPVAYPHPSSNDNNEPAPPRPTKPTSRLTSPRNNQSQSVNSTPCTQSERPTRPRYGSPTNPLRESAPASVSTSKKKKKKAKKDRSPLEQFCDSMQDVAMQNEWTRHLPLEERKSIGVLYVLVRWLWAVGVVDTPANLVTGMNIKSYYKMMAKPKAKRRTPSPAASSPSPSPSASPPPSSSCPVVPPKPQLLPPPGASSITQSTAPALPTKPSASDQSLMLPGVARHPHSSVSDDSDILLTVAELLDYLLFPTGDDPLLEPKRTYVENEVSELGGGMAMLSGRDVVSNVAHEKDRPSGSRSNSGDNLYAGIGGDYARAHRPPPPPPTQGQQQQQQPPPHGVPTDLTTHNQLALPPAPSGDDSTTSSALVVRAATSGPPVLPPKPPESDFESQGKYADHREKREEFRRRVRMKFCRHITEEHKAQLIYGLLILSIGKAGCYDGRVRVALHYLADLLQYPIPTVNGMERHLVTELMGKNALKDKEDKKKKLTESRKRWLKIGAAAAVGGAVLFITAGLAAPLIIPAIVGLAGFLAVGGLMAAGGPLLLAAVFGAAGAGLAGYKMSKRTAGVEEFEFDLLSSSYGGPAVLPIPEDTTTTTTTTATNAAATTVSTTAAQRPPLIIPPPRPIKPTSPHPDASEASSDAQDTDTPSRAPLSRRDAALLSKPAKPNYLSPHDRHSPTSVSPHVSPEPSPRDAPQRPSKPAYMTDDPLSPRLPPKPAHDPLSPRLPPKPTNSAATAGSSSSRATTVPTTASSSEIKAETVSSAAGTQVIYEPQSMHVMVCVSGWCTKRANVTRQWAVPATAADISAEVYGLRWESKKQRDLGKAITDMATKFVATQGAKYAVIAVGGAAIVAALTIPLACIGAMSVIDNPWSLLTDRADKAATLLADAILNRAQGIRPVTLIGFSLGARLIFQALDIVARKAGDKVAHGLVGNVFLLGCPISVPKKHIHKKWSAIRRIVGGRLVNAYCTDDVVLRYIFRGAHLTRDNIAGLGPVICNGVENVDITTLVEGHLNYASRLREIMLFLEVSSSVPPPFPPATIVAVKKKEKSEKNKEKVAKYVPGKTPSFLQPSPSPLPITNANDPPPEDKQLAVDVVFGRGRGQPPWSAARGSGAPPPRDAGGQSLPHPSER